MRIDPEAARRIRPLRPRPRTPLTRTAGRTASPDRRNTSATPIEPAAPARSAAKPPMRTLLVASCGWPTEAAQPARRRGPRR